jgi:hypothetical protein
MKWSTNGWTRCGEALWSELKQQEACEENCNFCEQDIVSALKVQLSL